LKELGWEVATFFFGRIEKLSVDARNNFDRWIEIGDVHLLSFPEVTAEEVDRFERFASHRHDIEQDPGAVAWPPILIIDALFGIGLARPLSGLGEIPAHWDYLTNFRDLNDTRVVAIDVPSGLGTDSGAPLWGEETVFPVLGADLTVTFHAPKPCHLLPEATGFCGKVIVKDIAI